MRFKKFCFYPGGHSTGPKTKAGRQLYAEAKNIHVQKRGQISKAIRKMKPLAHLF